MRRAGDRPKVALAEWTEFERVGEVLDQVLGLMGGLEKYVRPGDYVLLKPNLTAGAPASSGGTTHWELVMALVERLKKLRPGRIAIGEGTPTFADGSKAFDMLGYTQHFGSLEGVELIDLDEGPHEEIRLPDPLYRGPLRIASPITECDVYISVPLLKNHPQAGITVALKNAWGLVPSLERRDHSQLEEGLVDLNRARPPDLIIVDGWDGAEGIAGGGDFTRPAGARLMLAGNDPVALDTVSTHIMQQNPNIRCLTWGAEKGLGEGDLSRIEVVGLSLEEARRPFLSPIGALHEQTQNLRIVDLGSCSGCRCRAVTSLMAVQNMRLNRPLTIVVGKEGNLPDWEGWEVLAVGDCAAELKLPPGASRIPGCPPEVDAMRAFYEERGFICQRCYEAWTSFQAREDPAYISRFTVQVGGGQPGGAQRGRPRPGMPTLMLGHCKLHDYQNLLAYAGGLPRPELLESVVFLDGCPPREENISAALQELERKAGLA